MALVLNRESVVLTHDFSIRARSTGLHQYLNAKRANSEVKSVEKCIIANSYTTKVRCSTVFRTLTPGPRPAVGKWGLPKMGIPGPHFTGRMGTRVPIFQGERGPGGPILPGRWGPHWENGDPKCGRPFSGN